MQNTNRDLRVYSEHHAQPPQSYHNTVPVNNSAGKYLKNNNNTATGHAVVRSTQTQEEAKK